MELGVELGMPRESVTALVTVVLMVLSGDDARIPLH